MKKKVKRVYKLIQNRDGSYVLDINDRIAKTTTSLLFFDRETVMGYVEEMLDLDDSLDRARVSQPLI